MHAEPIIWAEPTQLEDGAEGIFDAVVSKVRTDLCSMPLYAEAQSWRPIDCLMNYDGLILACTADGRRMMWDAAMLLRLGGPMSESAPQHLQFPATHWMPLPEPPAHD